MLLGAGARAESGDAGPQDAQLFFDTTGIIGTLDINGAVNEQGAFFQSLGTNGRSCATCHLASQAMSLSAAGTQLRFAQTRGRDPLFAAVDGANCPNGRTGVAADHSLLLNHGLIRVFLTLPANAQFSISVVHDPYGCAMVPGAGGSQPVISVYRRPLPTANHDFLSTIMFDGRETHAPQQRANFSRQPERGFDTTGTRCDHHPCAGVPTPDLGTARGHRRIRARLVQRAGLRRERGELECERCAGWSRRSSRRAVLPGDQRLPGCGPDRRRPSIPHP
jgi:hypothetical protein